jgi:hypothetical protein
MHPFSPSGCSKTPQPIARSRAPGATTVDAQAQVRPGPHARIPGCASLQPHPGCRTHHWPASPAVWPPASAIARQPSPPNSTVVRQAVQPAQPVPKGLSREIQPAAQFGIDVVGELLPQALRGLSTPGGHPRQDGDPRQQHLVLVQPRAGSTGTCGCQPRAASAVRRRHRTGRSGAACGLAGPLSLAAIGVDWWTSRRRWRWSAESPYASFARRRGHASCLARVLYVRSPYVIAVGQPIEQPVAFSHKHHVTDDGIDCR